MCAWSRPMAANLIECVGLISGVEVLAGSTVKAPELCAKAAGAMAENIPASPALCRNSRRSLPLIVPPPVTRPQRYRVVPELARLLRRKSQLSALPREAPDGDASEEHGV